MAIQRKRAIARTCYGLEVRAIRKEQAGLLRRIGSRDRRWNGNEFSESNYLPEPVMPSKPKRLCKCGGRIRNAICDRCGPKKAPPRRRGSSCKRGYDRVWRNFRIRYLNQNPLCQDCLVEGVSTTATEPHHILKVNDRPDLRLEPANLIPLCHYCHCKRTAEGE